MAEIVTLTFVDGTPKVYDWVSQEHGFLLAVERAEDGNGYRALMMAPGDADGQMCKFPYPSVAEAKKRCYGMMRVRLEIWVSECSDALDALDALDAPT